MNLTRRLMNREAFMGFFILSIGGVMGLVLGIPIVGFVLSPLIKQPTNLWRDVGAVSSFGVGETVQVNFPYPNESVTPWSGPTQYTAAWLRRNSEDSFTAYAVYCTHLGCPVHWLATPRLFICPCHGSVFNADGSVAGGPAPRALFQYQTQIKNGRVYIKTEAQPLAL
ncbi:MAG TPA: ubiquinol-cytochrome c reductase iron-sulfur subunit [Chloroflexota bacterium]|nr:ubiquinol-cytochrome c reductase iron-sulfur subunit [Chloroflexota bacterium]